jgi:AcrR family transcriptional regulator
MALLPLRQAADAAGVARQTLYRYVKDGRITATVGHDGQKQVDTAELLRVFGELREPVSGETATGDSVRPAETGRETPQAPPETARLQVELATAQAMLGLTQAELAATREREARLLGVVESQTRLLEYRQPEQASNTTWPWLALAATVAAVVMASTWLASNRPPPAPAPAQAREAQTPQVSPPEPTTPTPALINN